MWWEFALWGVAGAASVKAISCAEAIRNVKGAPWRFPYGPGGRLYLLAILLHCGVAAVVAGAAASEWPIFRHAIIAVGLGAGASAAIKKLSGYSLALLPSLPDSDGQGESDV